MFDWLCVWFKRAKVFGGAVECASDARVCVIKFGLSDNWQMIRMIRIIQCFECNLCGVVSEYANRISATRPGLGLRGSELDCLVFYKHTRNIHRHRKIHTHTRIQKCCIFPLAVLAFV